MTTADPRERLAHIDRVIDRARRSIPDAGGVGSEKGSQILTARLALQDRYAPRMSAALTVVLDRVTKARASELDNAFAQGYLDALIDVEALIYDAIAGPPKTRELEAYTEQAVHALDQFTETWNKKTKETPTNG